MTMYTWILSLLLSVGGATSVSITVSSSWASGGFQVSSCNCNFNIPDSDHMQNTWKMTMTTSIPVQLTLYDMVVVCQVDRTFYLKNKHDLWSWNGLVSFESKHDLGTTISGSCSVTTNQGIEDACKRPPVNMTSTISDSQHRETTDLIDTTSQIIHSTTNDYESSTSDNQHTETTDVTVITASTIYTTNDDISSTSDNQHPETTDLPVTTASTIYTTNDDITSTSDNWHSETTDLTVTTGTTIYTTTNDLRSTSSENWFSRTTYSTDPIDHTINTTSDLSSSISTQSNASVTSCMCTCDQLGKEALVYLTSEDIKKKVNVLVEELRIDKRDTSLAKNRRMCIPDDRVSARATGWVAIVILCLVFGIILLLDLDKFVRFVAGIK